MKKAPLLTLVGLLVVTVPIAAVMVLKTPQKFSPVSDLIGKKLISGLVTEKLEEIHIADESNKVILRKGENGWVVANRLDYPIDSEAEINALVESIRRFKIGLEIPADPKHYAEMGVLTPDQEEEAEKYIEEREKAGEEDPADPIGVRLTLIESGGSKRADLVLGDEFGGDPGQVLRGMVVRDLANDNAVWKILGTITRRTGEASEPGGPEPRRGIWTDPESWLAYPFIEVEKIKSISLSAPNDPEFAAWTVTRESETGEFTMEGLSETQELDPGSASAFQNLFSKLRFKDILDPAEVEGRKDNDGARRGVITTFDGFTYTFDFVPMKPEEKEEDDESPLSAGTNYIGTVKVEGNFPDPAPAPEGEAGTEPQAGEDSTAVLKAKLAREKVFENYTYEFPQWAVSSLLKERSDLAKEKTPPAEEGAPGGSAPPTGFNLPGGSRPSAVTPPVRVPAAPPSDE